MEARSRIMQIDLEMKSRDEMAWKYLEDVAWKYLEDVTKCYEFVL